MAINPITTSRLGAFRYSQLGARGVAVAPPEMGTWLPFAGGLPGFINAIAVWDGQLVSEGGVTPDIIVSRWDGSAWQPLPGDLTVLSSVEALAVWNGQLFAGGVSETANGNTVNNIARWDGTTWQPFAGGMMKFNIPGWVLSLTVWNAQLVAGGDFTTADGNTVNSIARWDGTTWQPFAGGMMISFINPGLVQALTVWNGQLVAGGAFATADGNTVNAIARWDGTTWQPFAGGMNSHVHALTVWNGQLVAGGNFITADGNTVNRIARWDGTTWQPFAGGMNDHVQALTVWNGQLVAAGRFTLADGRPANRIAYWDGSTWQPFAGGMDNSAFVLTVWNGFLVAGGNFETADGNTVNNIAYWSIPEDDS